jgi:hypothetical protein
MNSQQILEDAAAIMDERGMAYGSASTSMAAIAARWSLTLGHTVTPAQVVLCMIELKLARLARDPRHRDSILDVIGYVTLLPEVDHATNTDRR